MCILFFYIGDKSIDDSHSLILASNRDEMLSRPTSSANYRRATDWKTSFIPGGSKPPDDVEYLGPVDLSAKGTWYSLTSTRRLAIVLNVRVPIGPLSILSSPKFFSKCFAACSYICAAAYVYLCFVKIDTTTANIEAREVRREARQDKIRL